MEPRTTPLTADDLPGDIQEAAIDAALTVAACPEETAGVLEAVAAALTLAREQMATTIEQALEAGPLARKYAAIIRDWPGKDPR